MKFLPVALLAIIGSILPFLVTADEIDASPIEQKLFDDIAARMEEQLHNTAGLLGKIRQTRDGKERDALMVEYQRSIKTTMKINSLMHQIQNDGAVPDQGSGKMMKGKKMSGGMKCCKMEKKAPVKQSVDEPDGNTAPASESETESPKSEHEGHH